MYICIYIYIYIWIAVLGLQGTAVLGAAKESTGGGGQSAGQPDIIHAYIHIYLHMCKYIYGLLFWVCKALPYGPLRTKVQEGGGVYRRYCFVSEFLCTVQYYSLHTHPLYIPSPTVSKLDCCFGLRGTAVPAAVKESKTGG